VVAVVLVIRMVLHNPERLDEAAITPHKKLEFGRAAANLGYLGYLQLSSRQNNASHSHIDVILQHCQTTPCLIRGV